GDGDARPGARGAARGASRHRPRRRAVRRRVARPGAPARDEAAASKLPALGLSRPIANVVDVPALPQLYNEVAGIPAGGPRGRQAKGGSTATPRPRNASAWIAR